MCVATLISGGHYYSLCIGVTVGYNSTWRRHNKLPCLLDGWTPLRRYVSVHWTRMTHMLFIWVSGWRRPVRRGIGSHYRRVAHQIATVYSWHRNGTNQLIIQLSVNGKLVVRQSIDISELWQNDIHYSDYDVSAKHSDSGLAIDGN